jgi:hypothetical protein
MGMKIVIGETNRGRGEQTVMFDPMTKKHFLVSSINHAYADETYIFECDENGIVENYIEVWGTRPSNHDEVIRQLLTDELTSLDFYTE